MVSRRDVAVRGFEYRSNSAEVSARLGREVLQEMAAREPGVNAAGMRAALHCAPSIQRDIVERILTAYEGGRRP